MTETQAKIGKLLDEGEQRDAIHVAVAPVIAAEVLRPGQRAGLDAMGRAVSQVRAVSLIGIIDPFLVETVEEGQRCWLFLYPNTVTGMRHEWMHPAFNTAAVESERWLRDFARRHRTAYERILEDGGSGDIVTFGTTSASEEIREGDEFWDHLEAVTGKHFSRSHRQDTYFRCGC